MPPMQRMRCQPWRLKPYRGFNLVVADNQDCFWLRCVEGQNVEVHTVSAGTHLISHGDLDDLSTRRIERYFAQIPNPWHTPEPR